jgi:hypothetical protein
MRGVQVQAQSMHSRTVLHPCRYEFRKICLLLALAIRTGFRVCVIFSDVQSNLWEVMHLSDLLSADFNHVPGMSASAQPFDWQDHDFVGLGAQFQVFAWMPFLPASWSVTFLAFTFGNPRFVLAWWLARGAAVAGKACFESGESLLELADFGFEDSAVWAVIFCDACSLPGTPKPC